MNVIVSTPCAENKVNREYCVSILRDTFLAPGRLAELQKYNLAFNLVNGVSGLSKDRGVMASYAMTNGFDKLVFIDSDMSWQWEDLKALLDSDKQIISGIAPLKRYPLALNFTHRPEDNDCFSEDRGVVTPKGLKRLMEKYPGQKELEILLVGTAFICIDVNVLRTMVKENMVDPFMFNSPSDNKPRTCYDFFPSGPLDGIYMGEDWAFHTVAKKLGIKSYINPRVQIGHVGDHEYKINQNMVYEDIK